ncbi:hypothetical protein Tsubulata_036106 [Turnera subulata]|uniref:SLH domain-containing protein n=1 Tax=Turnera subulata TaxID=218843 RepID=A0A9Q0G8A2_9ROSI|nr:hypothetical protein Tsubulata_036106 [Turnera subulata]
MESMAVVCCCCSSPNSLQLLRLAMSSSGGGGSLATAKGIMQASQVRARRLRLLYSTTRQRCSVPFASDNFAGWSNSSSEGDDESQSQSQSHHTKDWPPLPGGIFGAGLAGFALLAALSFAAFSLTNRTASRPKQQMEPLPTDHQVALVSDYDDDQVRPYKTKESNRISPETQTGSHTQTSEAPSDNQLHQSNEASTLSTVTDTANCDDAVNKPSAQQDLQSESTFEDESVASQVTSPSLNLPNSQIVVSLAENLPESTSEIEDSLDSSKPVDALHKRDLNAVHRWEFHGSNAEEESDLSLDSSNYAVSDPVGVSVEPQTFPKEESEAVGSLPLKDNLDLSNKENLDLSEVPQVSTEKTISSQGVMSLNENEFTGAKSTSPSTYPFENYPDIMNDNRIYEVSPTFESTIESSSFHSAGIPAPLVASAALQVRPGKILVPAAVDQVQGQALAALQVLKVIEANIQPTDLCTRREYARWLVAASSALSRSIVSKVYPAMYIEGVTELAFDDITPDDPDFSYIQGLAEAGLISSKLSSHDLPPSSNEDQGPFNFSPESTLSRQDLVSWKMALEKRQLPEADEKILYRLSGFRDINKINPDAWPALIADLSAGDQGIISLAFGCIRLFQPDKPVTKAQAAIALATGEASDIVSEELARIEAESMAEAAVSTHNALVAEVEQDINASFEKELLFEREKVDAVEKLAEEAKHELERLRAEREADSIALMKERAAIESEMEVLSRLRRELEEQMHSLMTNKVEVSYEKERISKLQKEAENEKQEISRLQYELEVERKALSMARSWAEDEAKRAREQAKALEEARDRWERQGIKVVVDSDLREESSSAVTWVTAGKQVSVEGTVSRGEKLVRKLKLMAENVMGKSRQVINKVIQKICSIVSILKEWVSRAGAKGIEVQNSTLLKVRGSVEQLQQSTTDFSRSIKEKARGSMQELQQSSAGLSFSLKEGAKRVAEDCREGVEKLSQKFKS